MQQYSLAHNNVNSSRKFKGVCWCNSLTRDESSLDNNTAWRLILFLDPSSTFSCCLSHVYFLVFSTAIVSPLSAWLQIQKLVAFFLPSWYHPQVANYRKVSVSILVHLISLSASPTPLYPSFILLHLPFCYATPTIVSFTSS